MVLALATTTRHAWAGPHETAGERFEEGRALMKAGRPAEAIPKFLASLDAEKTTAALLNLADAYEKVGKTASAYKRFRELAASKEIDSARAEEAKRRADVLAAKLSTIHLVTPPESQGLPVTIDGEAVSATGSIPIDPGHHSLRVERKGDSKIQLFEIAESDRDKAIEVPSLPVVANIAPPPLLPPSSPPPNDSLRPASYVVGGVGVLGLVAGGVLGVVALGKASSLKDACATYPSCPSAQRADLESRDDSARTFGTASTIAFVAGGVILAGGVVLYLVAPASERRAGWLRGSIAF